MDIAMIIISIYMVFDYYGLISAGDVLVRRKVVLVIWFLAIIFWLVKLIIDIRKKND